ncbi:MAG: SRPBCC domain-containing protein [Bacteroidota bacterium]|nr:SRPBCC domain-containing protein [Bacteroidota bacterium]
MEKTNQELIDAFFDALSKGNMVGVKKVMDENVTWTFLGQHKLAGTKKGIDEVIAFFNKMGVIMTESNPSIEKLIVASNGNYLIECQHIKTNRADGINIDHYVSVLWTFENGKIVSGRHFFADPKSVDTYFNAVPLHTDKLLGIKPVIIEQTYKASVSQLWKALTDVTQMKKWYFETLNTFQPEIGFETEFLVNTNDKNYLHKWKVTEVIPEKKITCRWKFGGYPGESFVTFEISTEKNLTKLRLTDVGIESFPQDNPDFSRESCIEGWNYFICKQLKEFLDRYS